MRNAFTQRGAKPRDLGITTLFGNVEKDEAPESKDEKKTIFGILNLQFLGTAGHDLPGDEGTDSFDIDRVVKV